MNRVKSFFALAIVALTLTSSAHAGIGGTDPEPKPKRPAMSMDGFVLLQIALSVAGM